MTEQSCCALCGAAGHLAAQCNWNQRRLTFTLESLAAALNDVQCLSDLGPELIAASVFRQHPEQAEGAQGEREAFEAHYLASPYGSPNSYDLARLNDGSYKFAGMRQLWDFWQARATLAQPSPALELDRPEVVAEVEIVAEQDGSGGPAFAHCHLLQDVKDGEKLMTVAQHDRIVGALRAENTKLSEALDRWPHIRDLLKLKLSDAQYRLAKLAKQEPAAFIVDVQGYKRLICATREEANRNAERFEKRGRKSPIMPLYAAPVAQAGQGPQAWLDVQAERRRQVKAEGFDANYDDMATRGQIARAASCYALHAGGIGTDWPDGIRNGSALFWPWDKEWWKPRTARDNLVRAGALILAEIERLDRAAAPTAGGSNA